MDDHGQIGSVTNPRPRAGTALATLVVRDITDAPSGRVLLGAVPGSNYLLSLALDPGTMLATPPGRRVRGTITGRALRLHRAAAGGRFIEPIEGAPRIVQGTVADIDQGGNRVLLEAVVPLWLALQDDQNTGALRTGDLVNCYVESGMTFTPTE